jgi:hypothetical protein
MYVRQMPSFQWRVTWILPGEENEQEIYSNFALAWASAQPPAASDEPGWTYTRKADAEGKEQVRVAWRTDNGAYILLNRV